MRRKVKRRLTRIVLVIIAVFVIIFFFVILMAARERLTATRTGLMGTEFALDVAREQEQIKNFLNASADSYAVGDKKAAVRFFEYAIMLMMDREKRDLGLLPAKMLRDPLIARKLGLKRGKQTASRRFGGG